MVPPEATGVRVSVIRLGVAGVQLARDAAARLAASALDASVEARRQAEQVLRGLKGAISERFGVVSRAELADLRGRVAALDRRVAALGRQENNDDSSPRLPLESELN